MLVYDSNTQSVTRQELRLPQEHEVAWLYLCKPAAAEVQHVLEDVFRCHPLLIEDCIKLNQRPKLDRYKTNILVTFFAVDRKELRPQEIALVLGPNYLISICQEDIPFLNELQEEFQRKEDWMDHSGEILYRIVDRCVDEYGLAVDFYDEQVERLERRIYRNPYIRVAHDIFRLKRTLHQLRRIFSEEKTVLGAVIHQNLPYVLEDRDVYFIDVYDHLSRVLDSIDIFRESLSGLLELQMAMKSDRMNEIMKTLTLISSLFLPLTFIAGVYGMNFRVIPELDWEYGYAYAWVLMIVVALVMWLYYKRKKWL